MGNAKLTGWATEPFIMGTPQQFARLREWLIASRFTEAEITEAGGVESVYTLPSMADGRTALTDTTELLSVLVQLFLDGNALPWETVNTVLAPSGRAMLDTFGLLQPSMTDPARCLATVALYVIDGVYMVSDRFDNLQLTGEQTPADLVFAALTPLTYEFVSRMPRIACADYLELCSGTGVAALIAANQFAERSWAVDITERSTRFAQFNAMLNGLSNVTVLQGDLYEPVLGKTFDLITAHPPYVPSFDTEMVFRDGGEDGEQITRAIISGLPQYLRPGGQFFATCMMSDRKGAPLEQRVRQMLGPLESEFDVVIGQTELREASAIPASALRTGRSSAELFERRLAAFERLGIEVFVSGAIMIQRRKTMRAVGTRRRALDESAGASDLQWLLDYTAETAGWGPADIERLLDVAPRLLPQTELHTQSVLRGGHWAPFSGRLVAPHPFKMSADCPPWFPTFLSWCDGTATIRALYRRLIEAELIGTMGTDSEFAHLVRQLADAPFIELPMFPLPAPRPAPRTPTGPPQATVA